MDFKKCERCGCFFVTNSSVCPKCEPKETFEMQKFKDYLNQNISLDSIKDVSINTGISEKNLNRFIKKSEFSNLMKQDTSNIKINL